MILVTGAAGKTGKAVLQALSQHGSVTRAFVRRGAYESDARAAGASEVMVGDLGARDQLVQAAQGARAVYHIPPNMHPDEIEFAHNLLEAASASGGAHVVYHSVLHPQLEAMPHHWRKLRVEELIIESGLPFTILQPAAYMQNTVAAWPQVVAQGVYEVPYPIDTSLAMVDLADVGAAAAVVLTDASHRAAIYELVAEPGLSMAQVADAMEEAAGRPVQARQIALETWAERARAGGMSQDRVDDFLAMFRHYAQHDFPGNPNALARLLGRQPLGYAEFLQSFVDSDEGLTT